MVITAFEALARLRYGKVQHVELLKDYKYCKLQPSKATVNYSIRGVVEAANTVHCSSWFSRECKHMRTFGNVDAEFGVHQMSRFFKVLNG